MPSCGLIYFMAERDKSAIYIGSTGNSSSRKKYHVNSGRTLLAALPGKGKGYGTIEDNLHKHYEYCRDDSFGDSESHFAYKEVLPYVKALLTLCYASNNFEWAKCCPILPWQMLEPEAVTLRSRIFFGNNGVSNLHNDWGTPKEVADASRYALGGRINLDPASEPVANIEIIKADYWFSPTMGRNGGLDPDWWGNVFLNPPYSSDELHQFIQKLVKEYSSKHIENAVTVTNLQSFPYRSGELLYSNATMHAILPKRIKFIRPAGLKNKKTGKPVTFNSPKHGTICSYFGTDPNSFEKAFKELGAHLLMPPKKK